MSGPQSSAASSCSVSFIVSATASSDASSTLNSMVVGEAEAAERLRASAMFSGSSLPSVSGKRRIRHPLTNAFDSEHEHGQIGSRRRLQRGDVRGADGTESSGHGAESERRRANGGGQQL